MGVRLGLETTTAILSKRFLDAVVVPPLQVSSGDASLQQVLLQFFWTYGLQSHFLLMITSKV